MRKTTLGLVLFVLLMHRQESLAQSGKFFPAISNGVPNNYMVVLEQEKGELASGLSVTATATNLTSDYSATLGSVWDRLVLGFTATMTEENAMRMATDPFVSKVVQDAYFSAESALSAAANHCYFAWDSNPSTFPYNVNARALPTSPQSIVCADPDPQNDTLPGEPTCIDNWGLDRIDQGDLPRNASFSPPSAGTGVRIYMLDSGIWSPNREFNSAVGASRVAPGFDAVSPPNGTSDCYGHGTHTAAIAGGRTYGIAKNVTLVPVRFVGCGPTGGDNQESWVVTALNWIANQHDSGTNGTEVVNWSGGNNFNWVSGTPPSGAVIRMAVHELILEPKILLVQSAGNQNSSNGCIFSFGNEASISDPVLQAAVGRVIVVGGSDELDNRWTDRPGDPYVNCSSNCAGSNGGSCLDVYAPAAHIISAAASLISSPPTPNNAYCQLSGTSMAAPFVAGAAALYLQNHPNAPAREVKDYLIGIAAQGKLNSSSIGANSPNSLAQWKTNNPPVSKFSIQCAGTTCNFNGSGSLDDYGVTEYLWTVEGYGFAPDSAQWSFTFPTSGPRLIRLDVWDSAGLNGQSSVVLQVP